MKGGFVGVDVFFVISGFLIGSLVYEEIRGHKFSIAKFYARRAKRILPALCAVLAFSYLIAVLEFTPLELQSFAESVLATLASISNFYFLRSANYFTPDNSLSPLLMTWSLGVEEQFYIVFPLLMLLMRRMQWQVQFWGIAGLAVISFFASTWGTAHHTAFTFYMLPTRAWELACGVLLAIFECNRSLIRDTLPRLMLHGLSVFGLGLIGVAVCWFDLSTPFPGYAALLPVTGTVLIIAARDGIANRALSLRPIVFVGLVSYSWYLWHWPLLSLIRISTGFVGQMPLPLGLSVGLISFACAVLSYFAIERPFRRSQTPKARLLYRYLVLVLAMATLPGAFLVSNGLPQRNRAAEHMEQAARNLVLDECLVQEPVAEPLLREPCVSPNAERAVALIGDSHASMFAEALRSRVEGSGYRLFELTKGACPPLLGASPVVTRDGPPFAVHCSQFNRGVLRFLQQTPSVRVVFVSGYWSRPFAIDGKNGGYLLDQQHHFPTDRGKNWRSAELGLNEMVDQLERAGKKVYLIQETPVFSFDVMIHVLDRVIWFRRVLANLPSSPELQYVGGVAPELDSEEAAAARMMVSRVAAAHPNTRLIESWKPFCGPAGCRFAQDGQPLFLDRDHLSTLGAQIALGDLRLPD